LAPPWLSGSYLPRHKQVKFLDRSDVDARPELQLLEFKVAAWTATPWDDGSGIQVHHNAASKRKEHMYGVHVIHGP
jgi:hypothetical protein